MSYFLLLLGDEESVGGADSDNPLMMLFNEVHHFTDPTGRALSEPFLRLPSRRFVFFFFLLIYTAFLKSDYIYFCKYFTFMQNQCKVSLKSNQWTTMQLLSHTSNLILLSESPNCWIL